MAPFDSLYGKRCRSLVGWFETSEIRPYGTDMLQELLVRVKVI